MSNARRDIGWIDHWVLVHNPTEFLKQDAKRYGVSAEYFVGFLYVDTQAGISIDIQGYCSMKRTTIKFTGGGRNSGTVVMKIRYESFADDMSIIILGEEQRRSLKLPEKPSWLATYLPKNQRWLEELRRAEILDSIRAPGFPDDIQFILASDKPGIGAERIWGRLRRPIRHDILVVELLNQPNQDFGDVNKGDLLAVQLGQLPDGSIECIYVGKPVVNFEL